VLSWESNDDAAAFFVERAYGALWSPIAAFRGDVRQTTVYAHAGDVLRIRSIGPGGVSPAGPVTIVGNDPRIRTVRP
jgi:hypothetical protein